MQSPPTEPLLAENLETLSQEKWVLLDLAATASPPVTLPLQELSQFAQQSWQEGKFKVAAIGRGAEQNRQPQIRNDSILWLDGESPVLEPFEKYLQSVQLQLNRELMLGIQAFEAHLARYAEGQFYEEHIDQSQITSFLHGERLITFVLYLNKSWKPGDGGELQIRDETGKIHKIEPRWGKIILFDSKTILHQVLESHRERWSLTGWFRRS